MPSFKPDIPPEKRREPNPNYRPPASVRKPSITEAQYDEITETYSYQHDAFCKLLEELTGIVAKPYTAYSYYDAAGNYLGDSEYHGIADILAEAGIEITED